jgi:hypothetical protein
MECLNEIVTILSLPLSILSIILSWHSIKLASVCPLTLMHQLSMWILFLKMQAP